MGLPMTVNAKKWPDRLYALDVSRGVAALSVVIWHWQHFAYQGGALTKGFEQNTLPLFSLLQLFYEMGHAGVQYFFLLSGFVFFWLYKKPIRNREILPTTFFLQRFSRLYPLHFVTLLVVALLQLLFISHEGNFFVYPFNDINNFIMHLGFANACSSSSVFSFNAPAWSVSIEVLLYCLFFPIVLRFNCSWFVCILISIVVYIFNIFSPQLLFPALSIFYYGGFIFHLTNAISEKNITLTYPIALLTCLLWVLVVCHFYLADINELVQVSDIQPIQFLYSLFSPLFSDYVLFPLTIVSLALIEINRGHFLKRMSWIGDITYSSYMLHFPLQLCCALAVSYGILESSFYLSPISLVVFFLILILLSRVVFKNFERPVQSYIRRKFSHPITQR